MGETQQHQTTSPTTTTSTSSRVHGMRSTTTTTTGVGEIVEVQGGHIVRSTGRKDRHSKVCTAKGPRDRRVRLSAHTAIQFYDVQDRLGYDRPSKAVDWLIKKAKSAIDQLAELPAWHPTTTAATQQQINDILHRETQAAEDVLIGSSNRRAVVTGGRISDQQHQLGDGNNSNKYNSANAGSVSGFLPPSLDTDIADTIKSFFPMVAAAETTTSFHNNYPTPPDLLSRTTSVSGNHNHNHQQDLRLSLQSFHDPILLHHHHHHHQAQQQNHHEQVFFAGTNALGFDSGGGGSSGWSEQNHQHQHQHQHHHGEEQEQDHDHGRFQRMVAWNAADAGNSGGHGCGGGFIFNSPSPASAAAMFGHGQYLSQRGPLQSSNTPSIRAWIDPSSFAADHHQHHYLSPVIHQASASGGGGGGFGFASSSGGFSGFRIPARIQGEEEHDGVSDKPSSASSDSRH